MVRITSKKRKIQKQIYFTKFKTLIPCNKANKLYKVQNLNMKTNMELPEQNKAITDNIQVNARYS